MSGSKLSTDKCLRKESVAVAGIQSLTIRSLMDGDCLRLELPAGMILRRGEPCLVNVVSVCSPPDNTGWELLRAGRPLR